MHPAPASPQTPPPLPDLDHLVARGGDVLDLIASYWRRLGDADPTLPVRSRNTPGDVLAALPREAPESPEAWGSLLADVERVILPGLTHWQSPMFFGYFPANTSAPSVLADLLIAGLGVQGMLWATSPAATELETRMLDWMGRLLDLPPAFLSEGDGGGGVIQGTASEATLAAMLAARHRARSTGAWRQGARGVIYTSTQAHSSVVKGAMVAGFADSAAPGEDGLIGGWGGGVRLVETDDRYRMTGAALAAAMRRDRAAGRVPLMVCATVGTTASGAVDELPAIAAVCREGGAGVWLHVDAAWAGAACVCPEHRPLLDGIEHADSLCFNPHKWLLTGFDCDLMWTSDRRSLTAALSVTPEYLRTRETDAGAVQDYRDWGVPLGRRFRSLKLWFVMRTLGAAGLRAHVREHVRLGALFEALVRADDRFDVVTPRGAAPGCADALPLVCFRLRNESGPDAPRTRALMERLNGGGRMFLTHAVLPPVNGHGGGFVLRMSIGGSWTREEHVRLAWDLIRAGADGV